MNVGIGIHSIKIINMVSLLLLQMINMLALLLLACKHADLRF